jgi:antitoxin MazE
MHTATTPSLNRVAQPLVIDQTIQEWGNGLGLRITAPLAKAASVTRGTPIQVELVEGGFLVRVAGKPRLSLAQKLKAFDPVRHGGEAMADTPVGKEVFE